MPVVSAGGNWLKGLSDKPKPSITALFAIPVEVLFAILACLTFVPKQKQSFISEFMKNWKTVLIPLSFSVASSSRFITRHGKNMASLVFNPSLNLKWTSPLLCIFYFVSRELLPDSWGQIGLHCPKLKQLSLGR